MSRKIYIIIAIMFDDPFERAEEERLELEREELRQCEIRKASIENYDNIREVNEEGNI